uniref:Uncharacterized protein n=1 Tax=Oryza barthii TaxID=65489 RepID=A0A0D3FJX4_9ORYZ
MDGDRRWRRWRRMWSLGWMARKQQPKAARRRKPYSLLAGWMGIGGGGQGQNSRTIESKWQRVWLTKWNVLCWPHVLSLEPMYDPVRCQVMLCWSSTIRLWAVWRPVNPNLIYTKKKNYKYSSEVLRSPVAHSSSSSSSIVLALHFLLPLPRVSEPTVTAMLSGCAHEWDWPHNDVTV